MAHIKYNNNKQQLNMIDLIKLRSKDFIFTTLLKSFVIVATFTYGKNLLTLFKLFRNILLC